MKTPFWKLLQWLETHRKVQILGLFFFLKLLLQFQVRNLSWIITGLRYTTQIHCCNWSVQIAACYLLHSTFKMFQSMTLKDACVSSKMRQCIATEVYSLLPKLLPSAGAEVLMIFPGYYELGFQWQLAFQQIIMPYINNF